VWVCPDVKRESQEKGWCWHVSTPSSGLLELLSCRLVAACLCLPGVRPWMLRACRWCLQRRLQLCLRLRLLKWRVSEQLRQRPKSQMRGQPGRQGFVVCFLLSLYASFCRVFAEACWMCPRAAWLDMSCLNQYLHARGRVSHCIVNLHRPPTARQNSGQITCSCRIR
jgi:hypothetical protein